MVMWLSLLAACVLAGCADRPAAGTRFVPARAGVLTVATAFIPAPGFWRGSDAGDGGFEAELASRLGERLGLDRVEVVQVPFARIAQGDFGGADMALTQMTPTEERERSVDFTTPYLSSPPGVLVRAGTNADDVAALRELRWVAVRVSTLTSIVTEAIQPDEPPMLVDDRGAALGRLRDGAADALLLDLPVALGLARAEPSRYDVIGQLRGREGLAGVLPSGSENLEIVDSAIRALQADGTLGDLEQRWLGHADDVPLIIATAVT